MSNRLRIPNFYENKNILITGGTGSIGVALVEKILRSFPQIGKLFLLIRSSKGKNVQQRSSEYFDIEGFHNMKSINPEFRKKVVWLEGDVSQIGLGLADESKNIIKNSVNIIFHCAATINPNDTLKSIINLNIRGTNELLKIAQNCKNIASILHVSTAFCYAKNTRELVKDKIYPHPVDPMLLIEMAKTQSEQNLENLKNELLLDWPNSYIYTKNATESLVQQYIKALPVGIHRPGAAIQAYKEPYPYWIYRPSGYYIYLREAAKGNIHLGNPGVTSHCIPMDMIVNSMIAAAYDIALNKDNSELKVYNCTSSLNPVTINDGIKWYLEGMNVNSIPYFASLKYKLTCHVRDAILSMKGEERRYVKATKKYEDFFSQFEFYSMKQYELKNETLEELWNKMDDEEKKLLCFDSKLVNWRDYFLKMHEATFHRK